MRQALLRITVLTVVSVAIEACGGTGSSTSSGNGSVSFRAFWEGGRGAVSAAQEACGNDGFGSEVPDTVNTVRVVFKANDGNFGCCTAVHRNGANFARRVVLTAIPAGNAAITVDGFAEDFAPDDGLNTCQTTADDPGDPCMPGLAVPNYITCQPSESLDMCTGAPVTIIENALVEVSNLCIRNRPIPTATPSDTPTQTPSATESSTPTDTPTQTPTRTSTPTATTTFTPTEIVTETPTLTASETPTATETATVTATATPSPSATETPTDTATPTASPTPEDVTLRLGTATGAPGQVATFSVVVSTAGRSVDAVQNEIGFTAEASIAANGNGEPDCATTTGNLAAVFLPTGCMPGDCTGARFTYGRTSIPDGTEIYTCNVNISTNASPGTYDLVCQNAIYVNSNIMQFPAFCTNGSIIVE